MCASIERTAHKHPWIYVDFAYLQFTVYNLLNHNKITLANNSLAAANTSRSYLWTTRHNSQISCMHEVEARQRERCTETLLVCVIVNVRAKSDTPTDNNKNCIRISRCEVCIWPPCTLGRMKNTRRHEWLRMSPAAHLRGREKRSWTPELIFQRLMQPQTLALGIAQKHTYAAQCSDIMVGFYPCPVHFNCSGRLYCVTVEPQASQH